MKQKSNLLKVLSIAILFMVLSQNIYGRTITITSNTNWSTINPAPTTSDIIYVSNNRALTVNVNNAVCSYLYLGNSVDNSGTGTLVFNSGSQLTVSNTVTLGGSTGSSYSGTITMTNGGYLKCDGFTVNGSGNTFTYGTGTVELTSTNSLPSLLYRFYNLVINGGTTSLGTNTTVYNNLTLTSGSLSIGSNTLTLNGAISYTSGTFTGGSNSKITFAGTGQSTTLPLVNNGLNTLTVNRGNGITIGSDLTISNLLTLTSGILTVSTGSTLYFGTSATTPTENSGKYIIGKAVMNARTIGTGTIDFLGCYLQGSANVGDVTITRITGQDGILSNGVNEGIAANWEIGTSVIMSGTRNVTYRWLSAFDNGLNFSTSNKAQVYWYNAGVFEAVGSQVDVSTSSPRAITIAQTHFSTYTIGSTDGTLPVKLASFTSGISGRNVRLNWATEKEINNAGFEIQREEVKGQNSEFIKIGYIKGQGNTNSLNSYSFEDKNLNTGKYTYRLKQTDYNGNFEYYTLSGEINIGLPGKFNLSQNYPNPFNPATKIDFELPADSRVNITVYDITGKEIKSLVNENRSAGYHTVTFDGSGLSSGIYIFRLTAKSGENNFVSSKKMTLVK